MMGYKEVRCERLKQKDQDETWTTNALYHKRSGELVNELVDPICVIANANEILSKRLGRFVDSETKSHFEMIAKATSKIEMLIDELRSEKTLIE
ncbi:MAG: hypothetical protein WAO91_07950 [Candidatus Nitrosotenuis sp.]